MTTRTPDTAELKYTAPLQDPMDMLAEEGLEVAHERMKAIRFGWEGSPEWLARGKGSPRTRFIQEVGDFLVAVDLAVQEGKISTGELAEAKAKKRERLKELFGIPLPSTGEAARSEDVAVPCKWLEELAYFRVRDIRGSDDVPGFGSCVKSELNKMLQSLAAAPRLVLTTERAAALEQENERLKSCIRTTEATLDSLNLGTGQGIYRTLEDLISSNRRALGESR